MKKITLLLFLSIFTISYLACYSQKVINEPVLLFQAQEPLQLKLKLSVKNVKSDTNDSTYMKSMLYFKNKLNAWDSLKVDIRARGNSRRDICHFVPLRLKFKKSVTKGTPFDGNKKLKLVLPCLLEANNDDYIVKEYMAYKLYEIVSSVHFKTRLANIEFIEERRKREVKNDMKAFLIEDIDNVAKRLDGNEIKRRVLALQHDDLASIRYCFFQFMIANTDFSTTYNHNSKLLFVDKKIIPMPYDFDMSGLVNASYAVVSNVQNLDLDIEEVTQRAYKGYKRDETLFEKVRQEFIDNKFKMFETIDSLESYFKNKDQFLTAKNFVNEFFEILENDYRFRTNILNKARVE